MRPLIQISVDRRLAVQVADAPSWSGGRKREGHVVPAVEFANFAAELPHSSPVVRAQSREAATTAGAKVEFSHVLTLQCAGLARALTSGTGIALTCTAERMQLPEAMATDLALIALGLIASASRSFVGQRHGRIGVAFRVDGSALELTVEHSGSGTESARRQADKSAKLELKLVARLGGRLYCPKMIGGVRMVVTVPHT